jgi:hypothetical protein
MLSIAIQLQLLLSGIFKSDFVFAEMHPFAPVK